MRCLHDKLEHPYVCHRAPGGVTKAISSCVNISMTRHRDSKEKEADWRTSATGMEVGIRGLRAVEHGELRLGACWLCRSQMSWKLKPRCTSGFFSPDKSCSTSSVGWKDTAHDGGVVERTVGYLLRTNRRTCQKFKTYVIIVIHSRAFITRSKVIDVAS